MLQGSNVENDFATKQSIFANINLTKKTRSSKMTILLLSTTDKELAMLKERQDKFGKDARKEIKRRKMVGFWDGTNIQVVDPLVVIAEEVSVIAKAAVMPVARKVEKKMAGKGR
jgi:hypothetical protein